MPISDSIIATSNASYKHLYRQKFGRLLALEPLQERRGSKGKGSIVWSCLCDCGNYHKASAGMLSGGHVQSCGCLVRDTCRAQMTTHGMTYNSEYKSEYNAWQNMIGRCLSPKHPSYSSYGGRGITIDPSWLGPMGFLTFLKDVGKKLPNTSLGRTNNNGNYEPQNVRWESLDKQGANKRNYSIPYSQWNY